MGFIILIVFWFCLFLIAYAYVIYPSAIILYGVVKEKGKPEKSKKIGTSAIGSSIAVILSVYNEEKHIKERINNLINQDYDGKKVSVYVGSDGSNDKTNEILKTLDSDRIKIYLFDSNRGKVSVLNDLISKAEEDILVFTDANTHFETNVLTKLVESFEDDSVGAVCGDLILGKTGFDNQDARYWSFERKLKYYEAGFGGLCGANGANYAIRRDLFKPLKENIIVDDFHIVMEISSKNYRVVYASRAKAYEDTAPSLSDEFGRRVRIGKGNYQAFEYFYPYLFKKSGINRFTFFSHKVIRWFVPHLMVLVWLCNALLIVDGLFYMSLFIIQSLVYLSCIGIYKAKIKRLPKLVELPYAFLVMNYAFAIGFLEYLKGIESGGWERTAR